MKNFSIENETSEGQEILLEETLERAIEVVDVKMARALELLSV